LRGLVNIERQFARKVKGPPVTTMATRPAGVD